MSHTSTKELVAVCFALAVLDVVIAVVDACMFAGGAYLITLGGSWYFALTGLAMLIAGVLIIWRRPLGAVLYLAALMATAGWSLWDVGVSFWPLFSRLLLPSILAFFVALLLPAFRYTRQAPPRNVGWVLSLALFAGLLARFTALTSRAPLP